MLPSRNAVADTFEKLTRFGTEYVLNRWYSNYKGKVTNNLDTQQQGRVKVSVPSLGYLTNLGGQTVTESLERFAYPSSPYAGRDHGFYFPPEIGDTVWVWFEQGDKTIPHVMGSYWLNPAEKKTGVTTEVPQEFVTVSGYPTKRGIKTKYGHGVLFDDDPLGPSVTLWSGKQPLTPGVMAERKQRIFLSDIPTSPGLFAFSNYGSALSLDDLSKSASLHAFATGAPGELVNGIACSDLTESVTITTRNNHTITVDPLGITASTAALQKIIINDKLLSVGITTPGLISTNSVGATNIVSGAATTVTAGGIVALQGNGVTITSAGGAPSIGVNTGITNNTFIGAVTENYAGAVTQNIGGVLTQTVLGVWNATASVFNLVAGSLNLGSVAAPKYFLVDERFLIQYNLHTHPVPSFGTSLPPVVPVIPATVLTSEVKAS